MKALLATTEPLGSQPLGRWPGGEKQRSIYLPRGVALAPRFISPKLYQIDIIVSHRNIILCEN